MQGLVLLVGLVVVDGSSVASAVPSNGPLCAMKGARSGTTPAGGMEGTKRHLTISLAVFAAILLFLPCQALAQVCGGGAVCVAPTGFIS